MSSHTKSDGLGDEGRDPALDRLYAESAREEPPARLDAAILAAAHREVRSRPRRLGSIVRALRLPVAIAAVVVLSASLVMLMKEEKADRFDYGVPPPIEPRPDTAGKPQADAAPPRRQVSPMPSRAAPGVVPEPASPPVSAPELKRERMEDARQARNDAPRPAETAPPAQPLPAPAGEERGRTEFQAQQAQERPAAARDAESGPAARGMTADRPGGLAAPAAPAKPSPPSDALAKQQRFESDTATRGSLEQVTPPPPDAARVVPPPPAKAFPRAQARAAQPATRTPIWSGYEGQPAEKWLERIADLRRMGRDADAREMLDEFKTRFPDSPIPAPLDR